MAVFQFLGKQQNSVGLSRDSFADVAYQDKVGKLFTFSSTLIKRGPECVYY